MEKAERERSKKLSHQKASELEAVRAGNKEDVTPSISPFDQSVQDKVVVQATCNTADRQAEVPNGSYISKVGDDDDDSVQQFTDVEIIQEQVQDQLHAGDHFQVIFVFSVILIIILTSVI